MWTSVEDLAVISAENMPMRITPTGQVSRTLSRVYHVSCECDVRYYPLDRQICYIKITTSGYTQGEIDLRFDKPAVDLSEYVRNGEWEIVSIGEAPSLQQTKSRNGYKFSSIAFQLQLRRRLLFHILNSVYPVFLIGMLIPFVFKLGETSVKIDFSLTVLLSYAVYVTMIAENIPSTSMSVCYLSMYLTMILTISTLSIFIVILGSKIANKEDKVSPGVRAFVRCLRKMLCCSRHSCCGRSSVACDAKEVHVCMEETGRIHGEGSSLKAVEYVPHFEKHENPEEVTWGDFVCVLDSLLFIVFFLFIITTSLVLFIVWGIQYEL
ncbi:acetylcholine receptor subunit alpha-L1-like [Ostrea edulis]|uniref:acetylcholine receptor subunit alpha-L1-like n=1 Tax=Ostrea edulis TaxID=37623 RepID=UPI0024AEFDBD|nr:acetylcholine receptor subunit alpha-L1-like [Ostrea edulis]